MRRSVPLLLIVALGMGTIIPSAMAQSESSRRTVSANYKAPAYSVSPLVADCKDGSLLGVGEGMAGCMRVVTTAKDRFLSVKITDDTGLPVPGHIWHARVATQFCGETAAPIPVMPGAPIYIYVNPMGAMSRCKSVATSGTITAILTTAGGHR